MAEHHANYKYHLAHKHPCIDCGKPCCAKAKRCQKCATTLHNQTSNKKYGECNSKWKGGRHIDKNGYVRILKRDYPKSDSNGYIREHILVWEQANQKPLPKGWHIHHINGIKDDNRLTNLIALPDKKHRRVFDIKNKRIQELEALLRSQGQLV